MKIVKPLSALLLSVALAPKALALHIETNACAPGHGLDAVVMNALCAVLRKLHGLVQISLPF